MLLNNALLYNGPDREAVLDMDRVWLLSLTRSALLPTLIHYFTLSRNFEIRGFRFFHSAS